MIEMESNSDRPGRGSAAGLSRRGTVSRIMARAFVFFATCSAVALLFTGCATSSSIETGMAHPSIEIAGKNVKIDGRLVSPWDVPGILEDHGVSHDTVIHIRVLELDHLREAQAFRILLAREGYSRTALVTKEHAEAWSKSSVNSLRPAQRPQPRIRYRSPDED